MIGDEQGELEGLAPFLFIVAPFVAFVLDCLW